jgi:hypothetical protein
MKAVRYLSDTAGGLTPLVPAAGTPKRTKKHGGTSGLQLELTQGYLSPSPCL